MPVILPAYLFALLMLTSGCTGMPDNVSPVDGFDVNRYLGTWYEIARLDHSFERGLEQVTAEYSLRDDGGIRVVNQGYDRVNQRWERAEGKAYFSGDRNVGRLKVSFFGPFYGGYNIIDLDHESYRYAMVAGPDTSYLWILARQPQLEFSITERLLSKASGLGFDTSRMIFVEQNPAVSPVAEEAPLDRNSACAIEDCLYLSALRQGIDCPGDFGEVIVRVGARCIHPRIRSDCGLFERIFGAGCGLF